MDHHRHGRTEPVADGKAVPGGALLWADVDTPRHAVACTVPTRPPSLRIIVESGGAADPGQSR